MLHLQTKVLPPLLASSHLSQPISQQNFVLSRMVAKKNLQFSFISFFLLFSFSLLMPLWWHTELQTPLIVLHPSLLLSSCHPSPPCCISYLYAVWFMISWSWLFCLFKKKKSLFYLIHLCRSLYHPLFFPSIEVIVKPLFSKVYDILFKNHYFSAFS